MLLAGFLATIFQLLFFGKTKYAPSPTCVICGKHPECFFYKFYGFNSVENLSLVILWDFMYKARFTPEEHAASGFFTYLYHKLNWIQLLAPNLKLGCVSLANALLNNNVVRHYNSDI